MKKLISLLAALAVVATGTVAFAAEVAEPTITVPESLTALEVNAETGLYDVTATTTAAQATILAIKGKTIKVGAIQYINQAPTTAVEGSETDKSATFSFALNNDLLGNETSKAITDDVYVLTGGDGNVTSAGYIDVTPEASTGFTVSGAVENFVSQDFIDEMTGYVVELYGEEEVDTYISQYAITASLIPEDEFENFVAWSLGEADEFAALQTTTVSFESGTYSFSNVEDGTYAVALTANGALTWVDYVTVEGDNANISTVALIYGDVITAKDAIIDGTDIINVYNNTCDIESEIFNGAYDVYSDCMIDGTDIITVFANTGDISAYGTDFINSNY